MTVGMKMEGLIVSQDVRVQREMSEIMDELSIRAEVCMLPARAIDVLAKRSFDVLVLDLNLRGSEEIRRKVQDSQVDSRMIVALLTDPAAARPSIPAGAHVILLNRLSDNSRNDFRNLVYSKMVHEWRKEPRFAVRWLVAARNANNQPVQLTMLNISQGGIGLFFTEKLVQGDLLKFKLLLPETSQIIQFEARVMWILQNGFAGAEFESISRADSDLLRNWLVQKNQAEKVASYEMNLPPAGSYSPLHSNT